MTILGIALLQALPVYVVARVTRNKTYVTLTAILMALIAMAAGAPIFVAVDLFVIGVAWWLGMAHIGESARGNVAMTLEENTPSIPSPPNGSTVISCPSDIIKLHDADFVTHLDATFRVFDENALVMTLVAYVNQKNLLSVIEGRSKNDHRPKSLDELIRYADPVLNKPPNEIAGRRRFWFTAAGLLVRAERMAPRRSDALEVCAVIWLRLVKAARLIPEVLSQNQLWSEEEKILLTQIHSRESPTDMMRLVLQVRVPDIIKRDKRFHKLECVDIDGMSEKDYAAWQVELAAEREGRNPA